MIWLCLKSKIPRRPGVYIYKDKDGKILYVGKAIDLYHRVASYFSDMQSNGVNLTHTRGGIRIHRSNAKVATLVERIAKVETIIVESELEALILEANLIKKHLPLFNVRLTDDKDYLYIAVASEAFPKVVTARKKDLRPMKKYWGPFPSSRTVRETLKSLRKVFPWCSLSSRVFALRTKIRLRPCFYYHIGLCPGPCAGVILKKDYQKIITMFSKFMDGKKEQLITVLTAEMKQASEKQRFEEAAKVKKVIEGIRYLTQTNRTRLYLENPNFLQDENNLALEQLKKDLNLGKLPERIEGYDISNIQGREATGSMVVLTHGEIDKSEYRKFKIKISERPNDVGMHREIMRRRFNHLEWTMPDLIIIDGGRGQVSGVKLEISKACDSGIFKNFKLEIPLFGLAKKREWLYPPEGEIIKLPRKSLSLKLLQKLRDEAHRFAVNYHRKLHLKANLNMI